MKVQFHGPMGRVTGSCYEFNNKNAHFLVDCGLIQGEGGQDAQAWNEGKLPFQASALDFVVITHAHLDHCGLLPLLVKAGFKGPVWCTTETAELANINLLDGVKHADGLFNNRDVSRINWQAPRRGMNSIQSVAQDVFIALYRSSHILGATSVQVLWGPPPGGCGEPSTQRRITFSGDVGCNSDTSDHLPLLRGNMHSFVGEYAVLESTYGATIREAGELDYERRLSELESLVRTTVIEGRGRLVVAAFAIGRTQDIICDLHTLFARGAFGGAYVPVYLHAPMATRVNRVYAKRLCDVAVKPSARSEVRPTYLSKGFFRRLGLDGKSPEDMAVAKKLVRTMFASSDELPDRKSWATHSSAIVARWRRVHREVGRDSPVPLDEPGVILTGGGMCSGGPVVHYISELHADPGTTVALTGYAAPGTLASRLLEFAELPPAARKLMSGDLCPLGSPLAETLGSIQISDIAMGVVRLAGYSGHADQRGLCEWLAWSHEERAYVTGTRVFLSHGQDGPRKALKEAIGEHMKSIGRVVETPPPEVVVELPTAGRRFDLDADEWCDRRKVEELPTDVASLQAMVLELRRQRAG